MTVCRFFIVLLCFTPALVSSEDHAIGTDSRIVNGALATLGQIPYQALANLRYNGTNESEPLGWICGAVIIHSRWLLTAGHCVSGADFAYIWVGIITLQDTLPVTDTTTFYVPSNFNPGTLANDIGLIKTNDPIAFNQNVRPIKIASREVQAGVIVTASGFGSNQTQGLIDPLRYVVLKTIKNRECRRYYGNAITDGVVCAGSRRDPIQSVCYGDSGGPVVTNANSKPRLVAVISWLNAETCDSPDPKAYTRTVYYRRWIRRVTGLPL